ncbi:hypothetical protein BDN72DRAFT_965614 [Pluteus cervinus]|uniref:Uncharacterized protein n=1 Tax=Pluteus cervinus TaxID=181527 RepID=A0ACD3A4H1_9AGAR|nr:hypothetical protein BDN72DRAFT_965614 [Pluteus cervinus]
MVFAANRTPIAQLPVEILQEIFIFSCGSQYMYSCEWPQTALIISWVCRAWRHLSHHTPALWTFIEFIHPGWLDAVLSRSGNRLLEFRLTDPLPYEGKSNHLVSGCLGNLHRIEQLVISRDQHAETQAFPPPFDPHWATPAPVLVDLVLARVSLPDELFSGTCPSLRFLTLYDCDFDWGSLPVHPGFQKFYIARPHYLTSAPSMIQRLRVIGPTLEQLHLEEVFSDVSPLDSATLWDQPTISCENLRHLVLQEGGPHPVASILPQISLPHRINIFLDLRERALETVQALVSCRNLETWPVSSLELSFGQDEVILRMVEDWTKVSTERYPIQAHSRRYRMGPEIEIALHLPDFRASQTFPEFEAIPLPPIKHLSLSGGYSQTQDVSLLDYFSINGDVESIKLGIPMIPVFIQWIEWQNDTLRELFDGEANEEWDEDARASGRESITFQKLAHLSISGEMTLLPEVEREHYLVLQEWLMWRSELGIGLEVLVFSGMKIPSKSWTTELFEGVIDEYIHYVKVEEVQQKGN